MNIVGLDTASGRWHAVASLGGQIVERSTNAGTVVPDQRRIWLHTTAKKFFRELPAGTRIFCEEPLALKNPKTTSTLGLAAGAIWAAHIDFDLWWFWVNVSTWKKEVVGNGNASKEMVAHWFHTLPTPVHYDEQDFYDARALMVYGIRQSA